MRRRKKGLSFYEKKQIISTSLIKEILGMVFATAAAVFLAVVLVLNVGIRTNVIGVSMEPSLFNGQEILINRLVYKLSSPKRGDVVVFLPNGNQNTHYYVKRVVGVPGDHIQITEGKLYVNGIPEEDEVFDKMEEPGIAENEIELQNDEYFVLGDNRNNSEDSRSANIGAIHKKTIIGEAWFHLSSPSEGIGFIQ